MAITRWDPFQELNLITNRMNRLFQDSFGQSTTADEGLTTSTFVPPVDIYEDEHNIALKIEVPGIEQKDIDVRLENNTLTVRGERKFEKEEKEENFHRVERRYGSFYRAFTLPNTVDPDSVTADYDNGVLKIKLAKRAEARPSRSRSTSASRRLWKARARQRKSYQLSALSQHDGETGGNNRLPG